MPNPLIVKIREENLKILNPLSRYGMRVTSERMYPVAPNREVELADFFKNKNYLSRENISRLQEVGYLTKS